MLSPKRTKFRRYHRGRMRGRTLRGNKPVFGNFALRATECSWVTSRQLEAGRRAITRYVRRGGKLWIRVFPDRPITMRPAETRMGSGKGAPEYWVAASLGIRHCRHPPPIVGQNQGSEEGLPYRG